MTDNPPGAETPLTDAFYADRFKAPDAIDFARTLERANAELRGQLEAAKCHHGWRGSVPENGQQIATPCPACGARSLFIGSGGHLTCARVPSGRSDGCLSPSVADTVDALKQRAERAESVLAERGAGMPEDAAVHINCTYTRLNGWENHVSQKDYDTLRAHCSAQAAALASERERVIEACAKVCDAIWKRDVGTSGAGSSAACAIAIRALRGQGRTG